MRMMLKAQMDTAAATQAMQEGRMPTVMQSIMEKLKPEAAYFGPDNGVDFRTFRDAGLTPLV